MAKGKRRSRRSSRKRGKRPNWLHVGGVILLELIGVVALFALMAQREQAMGFYESVSETPVAHEQENPMHMAWSTVTQDVRNGRLRDSRSQVRAMARFDVGSVFP